MDTILRILRTAGGWNHGLYLRIENPPFMALVIEATDESGPCGLPVISVCHYGEQNGDAMRDPEMCFESGLAGGLHLNPFYWRNDYAGVEQWSRFIQDGNYCYHTQRSICIEFQRIHTSSINESLPSHLNDTRLSSRVSIVAVLDKCEGILVLSVSDTRCAAAMNSQPSIGYISLLLVVFGRQLCLPLPADLLLVAAGALVAGGRMSLPLVLCIGVFGCLAGDLVWFGAGRRWGSKVLHILCNFTGDPVRCTQRAHTSFARWGLRLLLIAKFIPGMDAIAPPIAGMEGSPLPSFVALDAVGSLLWSGFYVGLGFYFSHELTIAIRVASHFAIALALLIGCPLAIMVTWRITKLFHMIRRLRLRTISPHSLREKLRNGGTIALIDLLNFEEAGPAVEGIPGAVRIAPARLRIRDKVFVPKDVEVVLYCSSPREFTSARVALSLLRRGIANVFVLDGGLNAWKAEGYPVTTAVSSSTESHAKLGIRLLKPRGSESNLPQRILTIIRNLFR